MRNDRPVTALLESAARGVESAWNEIFERYTPLVLGVCRRHGVFGADAEDVCGAVWLHLVRRLATIREPEALPGWLVTTVRRECGSLLRDKRRQIPSDAELVRPADLEVDAFLLAGERTTAVRHAVRRLPERDRRLLSMLFADPPMPYADISSALGIPVGAIGPTRQRCLARVRRHAAIAALLVDGDERRSA